MTYESSNLEVEEGGKWQEYRQEVREFWFDSDACVGLNPACLEGMRGSLLGIISNVACFRSWI
ncbi:hypothetical protein IEQ34_004343 [Dendrobium chrysotoxum]|uniref:Uncharacterized protein n=1 Tax=Dendrobium chrysotoxum TaxID=161865 RepID=A0AAV7HI43_DENCH|nr:hypothetical protein IEQ34_004343 [Dendrobium chrysotoxum]